ncbi:hypothetical protein TNCV_1555841 [Trichonephila clavipes]|nr:hypothetical protein TNCV_1555841 [Trichonephila clavipes]
MEIWYDCLNNELGSSSAQEVASTDAVVPEVSSSAKVTDSGTKSSPVLESPFLGILRESGDLPRDMTFKDGEDVVYLTATS